MFLLIVYLEEGLPLETGEIHLDPTLGPSEWSYCDDKAKLQRADVGNYVFFHTTKRAYRQRFITAYFIVKAIGPGNEIVPRYDISGPASHAADVEDHYVIVGDERRSRKFKQPGLLFDRTLAERLVFEPQKPIGFHQNSELKCISDSTRNARILTDRDIELLLREAENSHVF